MNDSVSPIRVLVVDDHPLLREGIAVVLEAEPDMELAGEATTGEEAIERFRQLLPDVTLMDIQMPGMGGVDAIVAICREFPAARIIVLTTYSGDVQALRALKAGAQAYLLKSTLRKELLDAIREVMKGRRKIPGDVAVGIAEHASAPLLTPREVEVLRGVSQGKSNKRVAAALAVSEETVKAHMKSILSKLGANDRTHAVAIAVKRGILDI